MYIKLILFVILTYLIIRFIRRLLSPPRTGGDDTIKSKADKNTRKVSKDVGEYIDYEDVD